MGFCRAILCFFFLFAFSGNVIEAAGSENFASDVAVAPGMGICECQSCDPENLFYPGATDFIDAFIAYEQQAADDAAIDADINAQSAVAELADGGDDVPDFTPVKVFDFAKQAGGLSWSITHSLRSSRMEVGVDVNWGGAIVHLSFGPQGEGVAWYRNAVNNGLPDPGRSIQIGLYDIGADYPACWPCDAGCYWDWQPVQAGNCANDVPGYLDWSAPGDYIGVRTQPLHWDPENGRSNMIIDQTIRFARPNALRIDYTFTNLVASCAARRRDAPPVIAHWVNQATASTVVFHPSHRAASWAGRTAVNQTRARPVTAVWARHGTA